MRLWFPATTPPRPRIDLTRAKLASCRVNAIAIEIEGLAAASGPGRSTQQLPPRLPDDLERQPQGTRKQFERP
jgi:hypothetical protein